MSKSIVDWQERQRLILSLRKSQCQQVGTMHKDTSLEIRYQYDLGKKNRVTFQRPYLGQISTDFKKTTWGLEAQKNSLQSETLRDSVALFV